jgi:ribonucleotide monophosphatase NagD (HAD superfamily)
MMKNSEIIERIKSKKAFISDMDGVIYHGNKLLPGVPEFVEWLKKEGKKFLFLTNSSERTPKELQEKMSRLGIDLEENVFIQVPWLRRISLLHRDREERHTSLERQGLSTPCTMPVIQ